MTPIKIPWRQFIIAVITIEKVVDAVAWSGLHPNYLYIGTKNKPPPKPKPLKMPAIKLLYIIFRILSKTGFLTYFSSSERDWGCAIHSLSFCRLL